MPLTLYWYILRDLLKLLAMATGVLVMVLSLGFAFGPMTEGLLGPWQLVKVMFYLMPATLPYALPFAAAFAATLVFFRIAADNEITACSASGISYRSLCVPVASMGLALTLTMFVLGNWVVPWFWSQVTELVERDVTRLVIQQLRRRDTIDYPLGGGRTRIILRADAAAVIPIEPQPDGPYRRIGLQGVAAGVIDARTHQLRQDYTGEKAVVDFYRQGDSMSAVVKLIRPIYKDPRGLVATAGNLEFPVYDIALPFKQDPRMMSLTQLRQMSAKPELNADVRRYRDALLKRLAEYRTAGYIAQHLAKGDLEFDGPDDETYRLTSPQCTVGIGDVRLTADEDVPIRMTIGRGMGVRQRLEAKRGRVKMEIDEATFEPRLYISFDDVKVIDQQLPTPEGHLATRDLEPLTLRANVMDGVNKRDSAALYATVAAEAKDSPELAKDLEYGGRGWALGYAINRLQHSIRARVNERAAMSVNCLLVMLLAAVMAMLLRKQVPLAIFFWCFLPAIASMLIISSGANFVKENPWHLPAAMAAVSVWVGNLLLLGLVAWVYRRLNRN